MAVLLLILCFADCSHQTSSLLDVLERPSGPSRSKMFPRSAIVEVYGCQYIQEDPSKFIKDVKLQRIRLTTLNSHGDAPVWS